jgi:hypothetical protein
VFDDNRGEQPRQYCQEELMHRYQYINLYQRRKSPDGVNVDFVEQFGWRTDVTSIRELWTVGKKHISDKRFVARSNSLVTEMRQCQDDGIRLKTQLTLTRGKAEGGNKHDDRVYATLFALEGAYSWTHGLLLPPQPAELRPVIVGYSPRAGGVTETDFTAAQNADYIEDWLASIGEL